MTTFSTPFWTIVGSAAVLAAGVSYLARPEHDPRAATSAHAIAAIDRTTAALADVPPSPEAADVHAPPASAPTHDGSPFTVDALGRLVVSDQTLPVLDSWLALVGGAQPQPSLQARLRTALPPLAAERAWSLLAHYAAYRADEAEWRLHKPAGLGPRELLDQTMALRRRHFDSVTVQELFGAQEARALYADEAARILADPRLSEAQQVQALLALRMNLPPAAAALEFGGSAFSLGLERQVAQMRAQGESDAEVAYLRQQYVETEGEHSVLEREQEAFDTQRQAWELRHPSFVRQRDELFAADLDVAERQQRLDALVHQQFTAGEMAGLRRFGGL